MSDYARWGLGACMALFALAGLFMASRAPDDAVYWTGLLFFAIGVATIFNLVRVAFDEAEGRPARRYRIVPAALVLVALGSVLFHLVSPWWWAPVASNWRYIDDTINLTFWITGLVFVAIILFMAYCALRFRHRAGNRAAYEPESARLEWSLAIGTAIGVAAMLAPGLFVWNQFITAPAGAYEVEAVGQQWNWSFRLPGKDGRLGKSDTRDVAPDNPLGVDPRDPNGQDDVVVQATDLHLPVGKPVKLLLRSTDVLHSFYVREFRAKMDLIPGMVSSVWFTPNRTGRFQLLCAELCGVGHAYMRGWVVIDEESQFQAWLAAQQTFAELAASARRASAGGQPAASIASSERGAHPAGESRPAAGAGPSAP